MEGWIKLYRSLLDWEWYTNPTTKDVFIHILLKVNYENKRWQGVDIPRGSYITSYQHLAKETGLSVQKVRTALNNLKSTHEITYTSTNKFTRINVENWAKFQSDIEESNTLINTQVNNQSTNNQQQHKNIKNIKNKEYAPKVYSQSVNGTQMKDLEGLYDN